jgi:hypothetical protein
MDDEQIKALNLAIQAIGNKLDDLTVVIQAILRVLDSDSDSDGPEISPGIRQLLVKRS